MYPHVGLVQQVISVNKDQSYLDLVTLDTTALKVQFNPQHVLQALTVQH